MFDILTKDHEIGRLDCYSCEASIGECLSCDGSGVIHAEYKEVFKKEKEKYVPQLSLILECDHCDEYDEFKR